MWYTTNIIRSSGDALSSNGNLRGTRALGAWDGSVSHTCMSPWQQTTSTSAPLVDRVSWAAHGQFNPYWARQPSCPRSARDHKLYWGYLVILSLLETLLPAQKILLWLALSACDGMGRGNRATTAGRPAETSPITEGSKQDPVGASSSRAPRSQQALLRGGAMHTTRSHAHTETP
jgi:hypothetical protein